MNTNSRSDGAALRERIWSSFPVTARPYANLLGLLDIEASDEIPTAAVTIGSRSRLLINPAFAAEKCRSDEELVMLVLHELMHVALGHTRLFDRATPAKNWAFDCVINAQLCRLYPGPAHTALFRRCYSADSFPSALLRPPAGWRSANERWLPGPAGEVHRALYTDEAVSYAALFELLPRLAPAGAFDMGSLLGNHGEDNAMPSDPALAAEVRRLVAEWPMVREVSGRDSGREAQQSSVVLARRARQGEAVIRRAILRIADAAGSENGFLRPLSSDAPSVLPYRAGPDRRAEALLGAGATPLLYACRMPQRGLSRAGRVHVYLDVSGSMNEWLPRAYAAVVPLLEYVHPRIHLFSTQVHDVSCAELRRGTVKGTGGTDIGAVTAHMLENRVRRAVLLTDGMVGDPPPDHPAQMKKLGLRAEAVLTQGGVDHELAALGWRISRLPDMDATERRAA